MFSGLKDKIVLSFLNNYLKEKSMKLPKDSKTTILGVLTIIAAVSNAGVALLSGMDVDWTTTIAALTGGWGLIHAADSKKSAPPVDEEKKD